LLYITLQYVQLKIVYMRLIPSNKSVKCEMECLSRDCLSDLHIGWEWRVRNTGERCLWIVLHKRWDNLPNTHIAYCKRNIKYTL